MARRLSGFAGLACIFFAGGVAQAASSCSSTGGNADTALYYSNGIFETFLMANASLARLENDLGAALGPDEFAKIETAVSYNPTNGKLAELLDAFLREVSTDTSLFWWALAGRVPMPPAMRDAMIRIAAGVDRTALLATADPTQQATAYRGKILEGKKVVVVGHGEGNLFANEAFKALDTEEQRSAGIVAIASPDSSLPGNGAHTTLEEDLVIGGVRLVREPAPLPANTANFISLNDLSGHGFVESYLAPGTNSRAKILADIAANRAALEQPEPTGDDGIITVTLTWGAEPDVDLHAYEPNGVHVFYGNKIGLSGFLDVDDTTSFGPEHYFVECDTLEQGIYRIGVNYFEGAAPEAANVQVEAGLSARSYRVLLESARGSGGNDSPIPVASIIVSRDIQGVAQFDIQ